MRVKDALSTPRDEPMTCYAFLKDRHWQEGERLGWFGGSAKTEDEANGSPRDILRVRHDDGTEAIVTTWKEGEEAWGDRYRAMLAELDPDSILVLIDYHV